MLPFQSLIEVDKNQKKPVYQQIANQFIALIRSTTLKPGQRVISSRVLAEQLGLHRKTVVAAYDELLSQGWLESRLGSGTFVPSNLPDLKPRALKVKTDAALQKAGFEFEKKPYLERLPVLSSGIFHLDDGFPDPRLAPLTELARAYKRHLMQGNLYTKLGYGDTKGTPALRQQLATYLNDSRGLKIGADNVMVVRGTMMAVYLCGSAFLKPGDTVLMGELGWGSAKANFQRTGATVVDVPVDAHGISTDAIEAICEKRPVRLLYLTPHHNYPTTATLKADRRLRLLELAKKHRFIVFEDDYDYDFHYANKPLLPLASADDAGLVLYAGSFTKNVSPAFRVGYLIAPAEVVDYLGHYRRIVDRQGDTVLENAIAELLREGVIQKYLRQALKAYRQRRDVFCDLLRDQLGHCLDFQTPEGGVAVWAGFEKGIDMEKIGEQAMKKDLFISRNFEQNPASQWFNHTRLGFAASTPEELEKAVGILKGLLPAKS
jgi:GntR family transcriptional regulator / MocR family aminotransferase